MYGPQSFSMRPIFMWIEDFKAKKLSVKEENALVELEPLLQKKSLL